MNNYDKEKQIILKKMKQDIDEIDYQIKNKDKIDRKNIRIKNLKITKNISKIVLPYVIVPIITYHTFSFFNISPFKCDDIKINLKNVREIDNLGNVKELSELQNIEIPYNVLYLYDKWVINENNIYERKIKKYTLNIKKLKTIFTKSNEEIIEILNDNFMEQNYIFDNNIEYIETRNNVDDKELEVEQLIKMVLYEENSDQFIVRKQTFLENVGELLFYAITVMFLELVLIGILGPKAKEIKKQNIIINSEFYPLDIELLQKKLELRKENYQRLIK